LSASSPERDWMFVAMISLIELFANAIEGTPYRGFG
jgi:hypothetical protein